MHKITFKYNGENREGTVRKFVVKKQKWYLITLADGLHFVITPADPPKMEWLQEQIPGESIHPKEFIQALGSGVESAGIY